MGIRIHKAMGYGLTNLKAEEHGITDPRINTDSPLLKFDRTMTLEAYLAWLDGRDDRDRYGMDRYLLRDRSDERRRYNPADCVTWRSEYGMPNVLLLRPISMTEWHRSDDSIDWLEETYVKNNAESGNNWVRKFRHGFYPFNGSYMDSRDGRKLDDGVMHWQRLREVEHVKDDKKAERLKALDLIAVHLGFKNHAQAKRYIAPVVPREIRALAEFGELFTHERVLLELRPLLYCWWA